MPIFTESRHFFKDEIIHMGYCKSFEDYASWLWKADILPVTINQEFFGSSVMEAVYCNCYPLLPKRLTYPELFNDRVNALHFYHNTNDYDNKLKSLLINQNLGHNLNEITQKYDWSTMSIQYDQLMNIT